MEEKDYINLINSILFFAVLFAATPFTIMFVWNTLVTYLFSVTTIGYGGAFAVIIVRMMLMRTGNLNEITKETPKESLAKTGLGLLKLIVVSLATLIVGYFIGAL